MAYRASSSQMVPPGPGPAPSLQQTDLHELVQQPARRRRCGVDQAGGIGRGEAPAAADLVEQRLTAVGSAVPSRRLRRVASLLRRERSGSRHAGRCVPADPWLLRPASTVPASVVRCDLAKLARRDGRRLRRAATSARRSFGRQVFPCELHQPHLVLDVDEEPVCAA